MFSAKRFQFKTSNIPEFLRLSNLQVLSGVEIAAENEIKPPVEFSGGLIMPKILLEVPAYCVPGLF
jgi:hypothetical protein